MAMVSLADAVGTGSDALGAHPKRLHVVGRAGKENEKMCGEYTFHGFVDGRASYVKLGRQIMLRYSIAAQTWVFCRLDSVAQANNQLNAFAFADRHTADAIHPASMRIVWNVWDSELGSFAPDAQVAAVDAPEMVSFWACPRLNQSGRESIIGAYDLCGIFNGRPQYKQRKGVHVLKFEQSNRWVLMQPDLEGYIAISDEVFETYPDFDSLQWMFFDAPTRCWTIAPSCRTVTAPPRMRVVGFSQAIDGEYELAGLRNQRPCYQKIGFGTIIYYSEVSDRWLIDEDGSQPPSLIGQLITQAGRMFHSSEASGERCSGFAHALGATDPGFEMLQWHIWRHGHSRYMQEASVCVTAAPYSLYAVGRDDIRDNSEINGKYVLVGAHAGRPCYHHEGRQLRMFWLPGTASWAIGLIVSNSSTCVAVADDGNEASHPGDIKSTWSVFEQSRGFRLPDDKVQVITEADYLLSLKVQRQQFQPAIAAQHSLKLEGTSHWPTRHVAQFGA